METDFLKYDIDHAFKSTKYSPGASIEFTKSVIHGCFRENEFNEVPDGETRSYKHVKAEFAHTQDIDIVDIGDVEEVSLLGLTYDEITKVMTDNGMNQLEPEDYAARVQSEKDRIADEIDELNQDNEGMPKKVIEAREHVKHIYDDATKPLHHDEL